RRRAAFLKPLFDPLRNFHEHLDQVRYVTPRVIYVGLQQQAVSRSLVELDVVVGGEQILELSAIESGGTADQSETGHIEREFVFGQRFHDGCPVGSGREVIHKTRIPEFRGNHFVRTQYSEILRDQWVRVHFAAQ